MKQLAKRGTSIADSRTLIIDTLANKMKREGVDVVNLTVGEPDFPTPDNIKQAAFNAINSNFTKYTAAGGIEELRQAIANKYKNEFGAEYPLDCIVVSNGAKHSITNTIMAICEKGDEVIIPTPSWVSYPELVKLAEATPVMLYAGEENNFKANAEMIRAAITKNTKMVLLCSPSNPTGAVYTREELAEIVKVVKEFDLYLLYDEIYEKLVYDGVKHVSLAEFPEIKDQVILINGVSKSYAMTGWRIGYSIANKEISAIMRRLQGQMTSAANSVAQKAAYEGLAGSQDEVEKMRQVFDQRRLAGYQLIKDLPLVNVILPKGAFYLYADFSAYFGKKFGNQVIQNSEELSEYFLKELHVACVAGTAFGSDKHIRFSYACAQETFAEGIRRIKAGLVNLK